MTTGARRGELCALRWPHVRFQEGDLLITSNYVVRRRGRKVKDKDPPEPAHRHG